MKIIYNRYGIGNNYGDEIELHEDLKLFPELHDKILQHELEHTDSYFSIKDLKNDLKPLKMKMTTFLFFLAPRPSTWIQFLPFWYHGQRKQIVYDVNMILIYTFFLILIAVAVKIWLL